MSKPETKTSLSAYDHLQRALAQELTVINEFMAGMDLTNREGLIMTLATLQTSQIDSDWYQVRELVRMAKNANTIMEAVQSYYSTPDNTVSHD